MRNVCIPAPEPTLTEQQLNAKLHKAWKELTRGYALAWRDAVAAGVANRKTCRAILKDAISCRNMAKRCAEGNL